MYIHIRKGHWNVSVLFLYNIITPSGMILLGMKYNISFWIFWLNIL